MRSKLPPQVGGAEWAVKEFQDEAATIARQLVEELRELQEAGQLETLATDQEDLSSKEETAGVREGGAFTPRDENEERWVGGVLPCQPVICGSHPSLQEAQVHVLFEFLWQVSHHQRKA